MSATAVRRRSPAPLESSTTLRRFAFCASFLVLPATGWAQAPVVNPPGSAGDSIPRLQLGAVYDAVRDRNPKAAAARALAEAFEARVPAASLLPDPEVQLGFMNYDLPSLRPMG